MRAICSVFMQRELQLFVSHAVRHSDCWTPPGEVFQSCLEEGKKLYLSLPFAKVFGERLPYADRLYVIGRNNVLIHMQAIFLHETQRPHILDFAFILHAVYGRKYLHNYTYTVTKLKHDLFDASSVELFSTPFEYHLLLTISVPNRPEN